MFRPQSFKTGKAHCLQIIALTAVCLLCMTKLFAEVTPINNTTQVTLPAEKSGALSNLEVSITNRFWFAPASQNTFLFNAIGIQKSISKALSLGISAEYYQMTSTRNAEGSDFQDLDLSLSYAFSPSPSKLRSIDWSSGLNLLVSLPTSQSSRNQGELGGAGIKAFYSLTSNFVVVSFSSRFVEYFYEKSYIPASTPAGASKSEPESSSQFDIPPTFLTTALTPNAPTLIANCYSLQDGSFATLLKITPSFMFRNEIRLESYGYFDDHYSNTIYDKYGFGYKFAPEFAVWLSLSSSKNTDASGSIFDSKSTATILSLYWKI